MKGSSSRCGINGLCYDNCPLAFILDAEYIFGEDGDELLGYYKYIKAARATADDTLEKAQDGGAVTTILISALESGKIDGALVVDRDEMWNTLPRLVTSVEELRRSSGSKYTVCPNVYLLSKVLTTLDIRDVAIVGTPCQIQAVRNLQEGLFAQRSDDSEVRIYAIGLFCSGAFYYDKLLSHVPNMDISKVKRMDFKKSNLAIHANETVTIPEEELEETMMESCRICPDYTSELADISIGSVGSPRGWSTVMVRSDIGDELLKSSVELGHLEISDEIDLERLRKLVDKKKEKARSRIDARKAKKLPLPPIYS
ncbi:MAG: Coenzyme F420 hydrogenase/dehydrogenase, beta subunit C-terminal domain [Candidatus Hydrothermarchaeaceae archaeon]